MEGGAGCLRRQRTRELKSVFRKPARGWLEKQLSCPREATLRTPSPHSSHLLGPFRIPGWELGSFPPRTHCDRLGGPLQSPHPRLDRQPRLPWPRQENSSGFSSRVLGTARFPFAQLPSLPPTPASTAAQPGTVEATGRQSEDWGTMAQGLSGFRGVFCSTFYPL